ncbi:uncharacterized protein F4812DRAFT_471336 [Daldinia caldariorum]|uniref:uncharacterized protein n=1 Tax=Daldinia caldariorum TaxID=326644 RepID=UPI0020085F8C|nr:uncharacterized protein F4812DRAFT_471336 [Daldinia caldariorum]KAI1468069.1 hypothetical protein F4812DRAFT_471336 [Daldinia caldariorum]
MDHAVQDSPQPHSPMTAETQYGSFAQWSSSTPSNNTGNPSCSERWKRRIFDIFCFRIRAEPEESTSAAPGGGGGGEEPENRYVELVPTIKVTPAEQSETVQPAPTPRVPPAVYTRDYRRPPRADYHILLKVGSEHSNHQQQGQLSQGRQRQQQQQQAQLLIPAEGTQDGPQRSVSSVYSSRGGATGNCLTEPCGCCAYWCHKICCSDDD